MRGFGLWLAALAVLVAGGEARADRGVFTLSTPAGKCVDVYGPNARDNGAKVQVYDCHGKPNQQWYMQGAQVVNAGSGRCLDVDGHNPGTNGAKITVWDCNGGRNQQWRWQGNVLVNAAAGKCLDVDGGATNVNGGKIEIWDCHRGPNQQFQRNPIGQVQVPPQYQPQPPAQAAAGSVVSLRSFNYPNRYVREWALLGELAEIKNPRDRRDSSFRMVPGLADPSAVSFESVSYPGRFLRHQNFRVKVAPNDGSELFQKDATFRPVPGLAAPEQASFQSYNYPDRFLRHRDSHLWVEAGRDPLFAQDSTFAITPAFPEREPPREIVREQPYPPPDYPPPDYMERPRHPEWVQIPPPPPQPVARDCGTGADDPGCNQPRRGRWAMDRESFDGFLAAVRATDNELTRKDMIIDVLSKNAVTARQFTSLIGGFNNELVMMDVVREGAGSIVDPMRALGFGARIRNSITREEYTQLLSAQR